VKWKSTARSNVSNKTSSARTPPSTRKPSPSPPKKKYTTRRASGPISFRNSSKTKWRRRWAGARLKRPIQSKSTSFLTATKSPNKIWRNSRKNSRNAKATRSSSRTASRNTRAPAKRSWTNSSRSCSSWTNRRRARAWLTPSRKTSPRRRLSLSRSWSTSASKSIYSPASARNSSRAAATPSTSTPPTRKAWPAGSRTPWTTSVLSKKS